MPPVKKASRPRIDAIVRHIKSGSYDDEMEQIKAAMDERNKARQDAVLKTVRSVFGQSARVTLESETYEAEGDGPHPPIRSARRARPGGPPQQEDSDLKAAEDAALARERELEAEMASSQSGEDPSDPEAGIESNSPTIGSIPS